MWVAFREFRDRLGHAQRIGKARGGLLAESYRLFHPGCARWRYWGCKPMGAVSVVVGESETAKVTQTPLMGMDRISLGCVIITGCKYVGISAATAKDAQRIDRTTRVSRTKPSE